MRIALYQPDIPQNVGAAIRLCACLGLPLEIIEPCGFLWDQKKMDKVALDYGQYTKMRKHISWNSFQECFKDNRIILMTTKASVPYTNFEFKDGDILMAGRESSGVPQEVHESVDGRVVVPMSGQARSMNIINATAIITGEALRQTKWSTLK